jgi:small subunit ribosomal protein S1
VLENYSEGDVVQGRVTKVVTFGAFVEILPGVEGLVHISELAAHHVENPREVVSQGDVVSVKIIEVDAERRRLSLSLKRVEDGEQAAPPPEGVPQLDLSEEVFAETSPGVLEELPEAPEVPEEPAPESDARAEVELEQEAPAEAPEPGDGAEEGAAE